MIDSRFKRILKQIPFARMAHRSARQFGKRVQFLEDFVRFRQQSQRHGPRFSIRWSDRLPSLDDKTATTEYDRHYIYHPAWAARVLAQNRPAVHVDISSTLYFISIASAFVPIRFFDYRPADLQLSNLTCERADLSALPFEDESISSLSCMHVVEHVGLGRYGDPLDPNGDVRAMRELGRVLAPGGSLLFVVPVGAPVIRFNSHRIYSYEQVVDSFPGLSLQEFTLIPESMDAGPPIKGASKERTAQEHYGCGCFWFKRVRESEDHVCSKPS